MLAACAPRIINAPLDHFDPAYGYRPEATLAKRSTGAIELALAFSGGGTRAAALAYGVLEELRDTSIGIDGADVRLLDESDVISSVSGGSFTAAYYGLYGERIFEDFEAYFLRTNYTARLFFSPLRPLVGLRLLLTGYNRSDLAVDTYNRRIFHDATFSDLAAADGPLIQINATELVGGNPLSFTQSQLDAICTDLSQLPVARAVHTSAAVPVVFPPNVMANYAGNCEFEPPQWIAEALRDRRASPRRYRAAEMVSEYLDASQRPYLHLLDGGISDNLGVRGLLNELLSRGEPWEPGSVDTAAARDDVLIVVVNAQTGPSPGYGKKRRVPSVPSVISSISGAGIHRYNFETVQLLRDSAEAWAREARARGRNVNTGVVELRFDDLASAEERRYFNEIPTSLHLNDSTVDRLIEVGGRMLRESPDYRRFLRNLEG